MILIYLVKLQHGCSKEVLFFCVTGSHKVLFLARIMNIGCAIGLFLSPSCYKGIFGCDINMNPGGKIHFVQEIERERLFPRKFFLQNGSNKKIVENSFCKNGLC